MTTIYKYDEKDNCIEEIRDYDRTTNEYDNQNNLIKKSFYLYEWKSGKEVEILKGYNEYTVTYWD